MSPRAVGAGTGRVQRSGWAAALATVLVAATLVPVVQGHRWYVEVLVVVAAVAATGAALGRWWRHPVAVGTAQVVVLLLVLSWLHALPVAVLGVLPGPQTLGHLLDLAAAGLETARAEPAPAPAPAGLRLLVTAGVGAVAVAVDVLAAGLRHPAVAGLPLLAVYCVPAALAPGGLDWYWFAVAAVGFLVLIASDAGSRVTRWGTVLSGHGGHHAPLAATGRRVGAMALAAAVLVPTLVPGLSESLLPGSGGSGPGGRIQVSNPLFDLRDNLRARADVTVLTYTTDQDRPAPLRWVVADSYDGTTWGPTTGTIPREQQADGALAPPPGLSDRGFTTVRDMTVTVEDLGRSAYLPVPYPPVDLDVGADWLYEADTLNVIGDGVHTEEGLTYRATYLEVSPGPATLAAAPAPAPAVLERWTALPPDLPPVIAETARQVAGEGSAFEQATRLQAFFRSNGGFRYSEEAPDGSGLSAISDFLERRSGFCVHFAATMAVMARTLGIPARVAVGFLPGQRQPDDSYRVSLRDSHAWPELYFEGAGWMRFEPTPATRTGSLPSWATPLPAPSSPLEAPVPQDAAVPGVDPQTGEVLPLDEDVAAPGALAPVDRVSWRVVAAVLVAVLVLVTPRLTVAWARRRRWRAARTPADRATVAWADLAGQVQDLGVGWPGSATPRQVVARLRPGLPARAGQALERLARAVEESRYSPQPRFGDGRGLRRDAVLVGRAVRQQQPRAAMWRARWFPRSGGQRVRDVLVDAGLRLDAWERDVTGRLGRRWLRPFRPGDAGR